MRLVPALVATVLIFLFVLPSGLGSTVPPGGGGEYVSCYRNGTTLSWVGLSDETTGLCLSNRSAFYGWKSGFENVVCIWAGYQANVYTQNYVNRFSNYYCLDGLWHFSGTWSYNEYRFSEMRINQGGSNFSMIQYRK
jgi:hypothetical protein